ncbi:LppU/SCO3897 family protein [Micromonospora chersina]|uniref:LppU/SCO3897 family protein n=1 Tax=Micromonospora chersina TaxID=47854 RepID=UPI003716EFD9
MSEQVAPPFPPQPGQPEPAFPAQPPAEAKKSRGRKILSIVGLLLAVVAVGLVKGGLHLWEQRDDTVQAKAGDCIAKLPELADGKETEANDAKVVECTSTEAVYNVVGRVDGQTEAQAQAGEACDQYIKEGEDGYVFWGNERTGDKYYLLCLTKKA